jgi:hypothetical protein
MKALLRCDLDSPLHYPSSLYGKMNGPERMFSTD